MLRLLARRTRPTAPRRIQFGSCSTPPKPPAPKRSPHVVLGVDKHSSEAEIKAAFRRLAMRLHPDTRGADVEDGDAALAEVVDAYGALTDAAFGAEHLVAAACEMYSLRELRDDAFHDVHDVVLLLEQELLGGDDAVKAGIATELRVEAAAVVAGGSRFAVNCSEYDAVSDVKRAIEAARGGAWALEGRPRDRDDLSTGWELVGADGTPLSNHFFLLDYGLRRDDVIHAVVRRRA